MFRHRDRPKADGRATEEALIESHGCWKDRRATVTQCRFSPDGHGQVPVLTLEARRPFTRLMRGKGLGPTSFAPAAISKRQWIIIRRFKPYITSFTTQLVHVHATIPSIFRTDHAYLGNTITGLAISLLLDPEAELLLLTYTICTYDIEFETFNLQIE